MFSISGSDYKIYREKLMTMKSIREFGKKREMAWFIPEILSFGLV